MTTLFSWETLKSFPFKTQISSVSISEKHLFLATFSGSIFLINLDNFVMELHISFAELVVPIKKLLVFSDVVKEIRAFLTTSSGVLRYVYFQYNDLFQIIKEKTQVLSNKLENTEIVEILYSQVMEIVMLAKYSIILYVLIIENKKSYIFIKNSMPTIL